MKNFFTNKTNIILSLLLVVILASAGYLGYTVLNKKNDIIVPNFQDKTINEVNEWCNSLADNKGCIISYEFDETVEKDYVIYQSKKADEVFDGSIDIIISKGKQDVIDVEIDALEIHENTTKEIVERWADENHLKNVEYVYEKSDEYEKDVVFKISPKQIKSLDEEVKVFISLGSEEDVEKEKEENNDDDYIVVKENAYVGLSIDEFKSKVKALNLTVGDHVSEWDSFSDEVKEGNIIWHGSGEHYVTNEGVRYSLSLGQGIQIDSKKYLGLTPEKFEEAMKELGLIAKTDGDNDKYSDYDAGLIRWYKSDITYKKGDTVYYSISKGKKVVVKVDTTKYLGLSEDEFKKAMINLGLNPVNDGDNDKLSDYEKGQVRWYKTDITYYLGDNIKYSVSAGKYVYYTIDSDLYTNDSYEEFKNYLNNKGLYPGNKTSEYSDTIAEGYIIRVTAGTYKTGDSVDYVISLGKQTVLEETILLKNAYNDSYQCSTAEQMEESLRNGPFRSFTNVSYNYVDSRDITPGKITLIEVNGNSNYSKGKYPLDTKIVIYISK